LFGFANQSDFDKYFCPGVYISRFVYVASDALYLTDERLSAN